VLTHQNRAGNHCRDVLAHQNRAGKHCRDVHAAENRAPSLTDLLPDHVVLYGSK
jgi:hypothetical protein